jgi:uncharacterized protein (DUF983 family)
MNPILSILQLKCPVCHQGAVFDGFLHTNTHCPICGIKYEREPGYFTMAMYVSYAIGIVLFVPPTIFLVAIKAPNLTYAGLAFAVVCLSPLIFRYSRVIWLHIDQAFSPREHDNGPT